MYRFNTVSVGVTDEPDLDRMFQLPPTTYIGGDKQALTLREIIDRLEVLPPSELFIKLSLTFISQHFHCLNNTVCCLFWNGRLSCVCRAFTATPSEWSSCLSTTWSNVTGSRRDLRLQASCQWPMMRRELWWLASFDPPGKWTGVKVASCEQ